MTKTKTSELGREASLTAYLDLVREIAADAAAQPDPDTCLRHFRKGLIRLGFARAGIWVVDSEDPARFHGTWGTSWDGDEIDEHHVTGTLADFSSAVQIVNGEPLVLDRIARPIDRTAPEYRPDYVPLGQPNSALLALQADGKLLGIISVDLIGHDTPLAPEQIAALLLLADQIALAVSRGRLVAALRATNEALARSEARYRAISDLGSDYTYSVLVGPDGSVETEGITDSVERITGYSPEEAIDARKRPPIAHPLDRLFVQKNAQRVLAGQETDIEYRIVTKRGDVRWLNLSGRPEWDADHQHVVRAYFVAKDITERKRGEATLRLMATVSAVLGASLDYHATLANVANLVVRHLADWCVVHFVARDGSVRQLAVAHVDPARLAWARELQERFPANPNASTGVPRVLRTGRSELYPEIPDALLVASARGDEHLALLRQVGLTSAMIVPIVAQDRVLGAISLVSAESGRHFGKDDLRVAEDVGRRAGIAIENARLYQDAREAVRLGREAEEQVRTLNAELERRVAERTAELETVNKELESFSYSVAHDLRAPLRGIDGLSQALAEDYVELLDGTALLYLKRIRLGSQRMGELIDDLLSLARVSRREMHRVDVDLSAMARTISDELRAREPARAVTFVIAPEVVDRGDPHLLRLALDNLFENAWKFTSKHASARIEFGVERPDDDTVYFIRDDGAGFDMAHADRLFSAFQRLHQETEFPGTGIGLVTVQRIVRRHGGQIWAEGAIEQGAAFYFTLAGRQPLKETRV